MMLNVLQLTFIHRFVAVPFDLKPVSGRHYTYLVPTNACKHFMVLGADGIKHHTPHLDLAFDPGFKARNDCQSANHNDSMATVDQCILAATDAHVRLPPHGASV